MVQGKFKKAKLPANILKKQKQRNTQAFTRRSNAPIQPKKGKFDEHHKIKSAISKNVNKSVEKELRSRAADGHTKFSKAQEAVANHHRTLADSAASTSSASVATPSASKTT